MMFDNLSTWSTLKLSQIHKYLNAIPLKYLYNEYGYGGISFASRIKMIIYKYLLTINTLPDTPFPHFFRFYLCINYKVISFSFVPLNTDKANILH